MLPFPFLVALSSLLTISLFQLSLFVKCGLVTWRQGGNRGCALDVSEANNRSAVTNHRQAEKCLTDSSHNASVRCRVWAEELAVNCMLCAVPHVKVTQT